MSMTPFDDDNDDELRREHERLDGDLADLRARWESSDMDTKLRKLGVYVDQTVPMPVPDQYGRPQMIIAVTAKVNRVAFTDRVIDPEAEAMNQRFETLAINAKDDEFLDLRAQIFKNIAEGRDPLDNGDADEG